MSDHPSSSSGRLKRLRGGSERQSSRCGGRVKVYLHAVTDAQAALLTDAEVSTNLRKEIEKKTGAELEFDPKPSPVPGMKILIIRGLPSQIDSAVRLINQKTGSKDPLPDQAQTFWLQWVEAAFPDLDSRAYFLPPVYVNRVPMTRQTAAGQEVLVLQSAPGLSGQSVPEQALRSHQLSTSSSSAGLPSIPQPPRLQDSDVRDDAAMQRMFVCLQKMFEENKDVMVGLTQLQFQQYLGEPCYAAAATHLPRPSNLPPSRPPDWKQGQFDMLIIHRTHGFIVLEVKSFGDNVSELDKPEENINITIVKKLKDAVSQLDKAEAMLSHLVSDIAPGLPVTKVIAFPNLTTRQLQQAISGDTQLTQDLCRCLGTTDPSNIPGLCLCCDQLSDPKTPCDVSSDVLRELGHWWQRRVAGAGPDSHMTPELYKTLVARFCGPATTVTVPCTCPPRVSVKTLGQAVWWTGECYTAVITLFPEQISMLSRPPQKLFLSGPPGTGKTVVLKMIGTEWLRCGHRVYIVSTVLESRAVCFMLYHLLKGAINTQLSKCASTRQLKLLKYDFHVGKDVMKAVKKLSKAAKEGLLYVIADEAGPHGTQHFQTFCHILMQKVPRLHLWAASCFHRHGPASMQVECLTRPLRSPPAVVREVEQDAYLTQGVVSDYTSRGVPDYTHGPPVRRLYHRRQSHKCDFSFECVTCGRELANFLRSLRAGATETIRTVSPTVTSTSGGTAPTCLQWRDVLVLSWCDVRKDVGIVHGLKEAGIPVRVMKKKYIKNVATARSDVVWVARGDLVRGLERKVIVCLKDDVEAYLRLEYMSRCTSQLVIVCLEEEHADHE